MKILSLHTLKFYVMELEKQIQADMVSAMKAKEAVRLASLRAVKAAILLAKTAEGSSGEVTDQDIVKLIQKLVKQRKESAIGKGIERIDGLVW